MTTYWELLKDPRWQRKRLEIMERDEFACQDCDARDKTLNVHHTYYAKGRKPWEYEDDSLRTLCEDCHARVSSSLEEGKRLLGSLSEAALAEAIGYLRAKAWSDSRLDGPVPVESFDQFIGFARAFGIIGWWMYDILYKRIRENGNEANPRPMHQIGNEQALHLRSFYDRNIAEKAAPRAD